MKKENKDECHIFFNFFSLFFVFGKIVSLFYSYSTSGRKCVRTKILRVWRRTTTRTRETTPPPPPSLSRRSARTSRAVIHELMFELCFIFDFFINTNKQSNVILIFSKSKMTIVNKEHNRMMTTHTLKRGYTTQSHLPKY